MKISLSATRRGRLTAKAITSGPDADSSWARDSNFSARRVGRATRHRGPEPRRDNVKRMSDSKPEPPPQPVGLLIVRYGIGGIMVIAGLVLLLVNPGGFGIDGFALAAGGGGSVLMLNFLFRLGVSGDLEREQEEEARRFLDEHGHWPDEEPPPARPLRR
jgi:hypothetical protein